MNQPAPFSSRPFVYFCVRSARPLSALTTILSPVTDPPLDYPDRRFRLVGSLVVSYLVDTIARTESLIDRLGNAAFYIDLFGGFLMVAVVWEVIRAVVIRLDRRLDWFGQTTRRLGVQLVAGVAFPALLSFLLTLVYMQVMWQQNIFDAGWLDTEFYLVLLLIVFINVYYFTFWLYGRHKRTPAIQPVSSVQNTSSVSQPGPIQVVKGEKIRLLAPPTVAYAFLKDGYCYIKTFDADVFVTTFVLDDLSEKLSPADFFRANRQVIVNRVAIQSYRSIGNGKIDVQITPDFGEELIVSQKRAKAFREWIGGRSAKSTED